jgi:formamidopyrimidine-DNA glycosylase
MARKWDGGEEDVKFWACKGWKVDEAGEVVHCQHAESVKRGDYEVHGRNHKPCPKCGENMGMEY